MLIFLIVLILFWFFVLRKFKTPKVGSMCLVSGGVKTGKTTFAVHLAIKNHKCAVRRVKIRNFFARILKKPLSPLPLLYSNIHLSDYAYVPLTRSLLLRESRFVYGSVILCSEASLVADSQMIKNPLLNDELMLFNKLIGHETRGGMIIYDTQSIADCHYSIKRCLSEYFYIHHIVKWLPFFLVAYVREDRYSEDGSVISVNTDDNEETLKRVLIRKSVWKKFDSYCYSGFTDNLPVVDNVQKKTRFDSLKMEDIVSFRERNNLKKR